jgi:hypothetical protein
MIIRHRMISLYVFSEYLVLSGRARPTKLTERNGAGKAIVIELYRVTYTLLFVIMFLSSY